MDVEQWSVEARERFTAEVERLATAVRAHGATVLAMHGRGAELPALFDADAELARAVLAHGEVEMDLTGTAPTLFGPDEDDEDDDEPPAGTVTRLRVVNQADFAVTDADAVLAAGRAAYRRVWPDDTAEDAEFDVADLGRALYQLQHAGGLAALEEVPGLEPLSSSMSVLDADREA